MSKTRISYFVSWKCNDLFGNTPIDGLHESHATAMDKFQEIEYKLYKTLIKNKDIEENDYVKILNISII